MEYMEDAGDVVVANKSWSGMISSLASGSGVQDGVVDREL